RFSYFLEVHHCRVALARELFEFVENERDTATHSGRKVSSGATKHDNRAACHILTSVIAHAFDYRDSAAVANGESLARNSSDIRFTGCRSVKCRVAGNNGLVANELRRSR